MDQAILLLLLQNVKTKTYIGKASIEAVSYALENGLLERTPQGNFKLSQKGEDLLNGDKTSLKP